MAVVGTMKSMVEFTFVALTSVFFLVDPIAVIPTFLAITTGAASDRRRRTAKRAAWTCCLVLTGFALAGGLIFKMFSITLPAFKIAGGLVLLLVGMDMLQAKKSGTKETPSETQEGAEKEDAGVIPLGVPMLAGPGAISTVMVLMSESTAWWSAIPIFSAILITSFASYLILAGADRFRKRLGESGIRILTRMMGLLLVAIAVQFVLNGLADVGVVQKYVK